MPNQISWPEGKAFAFTIFDDADLQTIENGGPVYKFLSDLGMRTTKSVWSIQGRGTPKVGGATCEDDRHLKWVLSLQQKGFEIALHNVTYHTSTRQETALGLEIFRRLFGHYPHSLANHTGCKEGIYWGASRLSGINRLLYNLLHLKTKNGLYQGHVERSPLFWGDLCREKVRFVRNFTFADINTLRACPIMPYYDPDRPYVNYWFASSEGPTVDRFNVLLSEENQDRLVDQGGACLVYAHFGCGFWEGRQLNSRFECLMKRLGKMNGWFAPVSTVLDYILQARGNHTITARERSNLERKWLWHKVYSGGTR